MHTLIIILVVISCLILSLIILIQNPKGGGLDSSFASANQIGGVKRTADFLEKSTWGLITAILALCLVSAAFDETGPATIKSDFDDEINEEQFMPQAPAEEEGFEEYND
jgi:preprotein translocase subunit SecG